MKHIFLLFSCCILYTSIFSQQNVGFGITSPKSKIDVNGNATIGSDYSGTNGAPSNGAIIEGNVGIGTPSPDNALSVAPLQYSTGTASQSTTTVTGSGTTFTAGMVGGEVVFANGTKATITAFNSSTSLTVSPSQTVSSQTYAIHYLGLQVASTGNVGIGTATPDASAALDVTSSSKGVSFPNVALASASDNTTIISPKKGLIVYNTGFGTAGLYINNGTSSSPSWVRIADANTVTSSIQPLSNTSGGGLSTFSYNGSSATQIGIASGGVTGGMIATGTVTGSNIASNTITNSNLATSAVVNAATQIFNVLPVANGGTGDASLTADGVLYGNGTSAVGVTSAPLAGQVLIGNGVGVPTFTTLSGDVGAVGGTGSVTIANNAVTYGKFQQVAANSLVGNPTGSGANAQAIAIGSGLSISGSGPYTLTASGTGGTVTGVSVATANGLAGTSSGGTTPQLTLSTTITGMLKGNGTAISAATAGTDYQAPMTAGTGITISSNQINSYWTFNSNNLYNNNSGNVGIGLTSPSVPLEVGSTGSTEVRISSTVGSATTFGASQLSFVSNKGTGIEWRPGYIIAQDGNGGGTYTGRLDFYTNGTGSGNKYGFTYAMSIMNGYVGIGTTSPPSPFSAVYGSAGTNTYSGSAGNWYDPTNYAGYVQNNNNATSHYGLLVSDFWRSSENFVFAVDGRYYNNGSVSGDTHNPYLIVRGDGNVGIGTSAPSSMLSVGSSSQFQVNSSGAIATATGITSSGTITFSGLPANSAVYTTTGGQLTTAVPSSGTLGYWTLSGSNLYPSSTGDVVGVGTTSPQNKLDVQGGNIDASGYIMAGQSGTTQGGAVMFAGTTAVNGAGSAGGASFSGRPRIGDWGQWLTIGEPNGTNSGLIMQIVGTGGSPGIGIFTGTSSGLTSAPTLRNVLDNGSGKMGIMTTSPGANLQVAGGGIQDLIVGNTGNSQQILMGNGSGYSSIQAILQGTADNILALNSGGGNVGIGTTSAVAKLDVNGSIATNRNWIYLAGANDLNHAVGNLLNYNGNDAEQFRFCSYLELYSGCSSLTAMHITGSTGNVGIGTTTPGYRLDVNGVINVGADPSTGILGTGSRIILATGGASATTLEENWGVNITGTATQPTRIYNASLLVGYGGYGTNYGTGNFYVSGNVGIGTTSPLQKLDVQGNIALNNNYLYIRAGNDGNHYIAYNSTFDGPIISGCGGVQFYSQCHNYRLGVIYPYDNFYSSSYGSMSAMDYYAWYYGDVYRDVENDLDAIDNIKPLVATNPITGKTAVVNDPKTMPFDIAVKANDDSTNYGISVTKLSSFSLGAIRQLRHETKTHDEAQDARIDRLEKLVSELTGKQLGQMDFTAAATAYKGMENYVIMDARITSASKISIDGLNGYAVKLGEGSMEIKFATPPSQDTKFTYSGKF